MASSRQYPSHSFAPSAPELPPEPYEQQQQQTYSYSHHESPPSHSYYGQLQPSSYGQSGFPAGTHAGVVRAFQMVDRDRSGFIDENELQQALSSGYERFSIRTIRFLMFLFKNNHDSLRIGPREFAALWSCLGHWRVSD
ncbi:hypothetical protein CRYUN_Cryun11dG0111300 [Craigia yunnanensis]